MTPRSGHRARLLALLLAAAPLAPLAAQTAGPAPETAPPAGEQGEAPLTERLGEAAREALEKLEREVTPLIEQTLEALGRLDDYGPPRVLENGDILIPRKPDAPAPGEPPDPETRDAEPDKPDTLEL